MKKIFLILLFIILLLCLVAYKLAHQPIPKSAPPPADYTTTTIPSQFSHDNIEHLDNLKLEEEITQLSNKDSTHYSVFVAYPDKNCEPYIYQSSPMCSASMIQVFILASLMENIRNGKISLDDLLTLHTADKVGGAGILVGYASGTNLPIRQIAQLMITESDNTATNMLIDLLGMDTINTYMIQNGYTDSKLQRKMMDLKAVNEGKENYTSVTDLGNFFLKLYKHECINYELDELMLKYLKEQTDTECFPTALPYATIAHKTGELTGIYDDGGIIYTNNKTTVLVIMTDNYSTRNHAIHTMQEMAKCVVKN